MAGGWLDVRAVGAVGEGSVPRRTALRSGLTRVGGEGSDLVVPGSGTDALHVWDEPARFVFVGEGERPRLAGRTVDEAPLRHGDRIAWRGVELEYRGPAALEEVAGGAASSAASEPRAWRRLRAGMLVELGLADRQATARWQRAVREGAFDADRAADELLRGSVALPDDPRLLERSGRLLRDLVMAPLQRGVRGASRRTRAAVKGGVAMVVAQLVAFLVYTVIVLVALLVLRAKGVELDAWLDRLLLRG